MTEHYYTNKPSTSSEQRKWSFVLRGQQFKFITDNGVFSKSEVDFGSRLLIDTFVTPDVEGRILDIGCGYGPLGLAIAKCETSRLIEMVDVNERAIELSKLNAGANDVRNVHVYSSDRFENVKEQEFAAILSNPPIRAGKKVVHDILEKSYQYLASLGELWIVIQKKQGAPSAIEKLNTVFPYVEVVAKKKGYFIIKAKKD